MTKILGYIITCEKCGTEIEDYDLHKFEHFCPFCKNSIYTELSKINYNINRPDIFRFEVTGKGFKSIRFILSD